MLTFDYDCPTCTTRFEAQVASARAKPKCPKCGATDARRLPSAPAVRGASPDAPILPTRGASAHGCGCVERPGAKER
jgi:putative FmdB family regulatory protein